MEAPSTARPPQSALRANRAILVVAIVVGLLVLGFGLNAVRQRIQVRVESDTLRSPNLTLTPVVKGLKEPTWYVGAPDGRFFALERAGTVRLVHNGQLASAPVLDLTDRISLDTEEGLLCLVFDRHFSDNGYVYVDYTDKSLAVQVVRYQFMANDPDRLDPASAHTVLSLPKQHSAHNGGTLAMG
ncbi:MAG: PQQ-dependent sugar dehydrogenase, partial [Chloroflexi bacterium]|nr:PQQ-dependent sugar dehydrogenase [Chloroflexota bacterium]